MSGLQASQAAVQSDAARAPSTLQALSQPAAATPPVDVERVAKIKKAIADGKFPLIPSSIADRLLALKLEWHPNEPA
ncbi:flagellar biosynthesis anti-sigma factor FlgM [Sphingomonas donggukensis]|uniref:Negative regulator of flagellin synthesis n=1 Tax=Sphingomonas donggukensis TaxID=2949093 RepID=A0ABY4TYC1_9SPHN|nr:flagellar biosynthesis anti-sigma factor FlgM [Sphingomonas donggukensis]URW75546.1 flagellar biosynthesis anti-sigma factor FlgM [Sphingomonas donggukensis]